MAKRLFIVLVNTDPRNYESVAALQGRPRRLAAPTTTTSGPTSATATKAAVRGRPWSASSASHPQDKKGQEDSSPEPHRYAGLRSTCPAETDTRTTSCLSK
jgi:hypothetical protein